MESEGIGAAPKESLVTNADDEPVLTAEIRAWIGREGPEESAEVTQREIERYAHAVGNLSPLFLDEAVAADSPFGGLVAPFQFYSIPFIEPLPHAALREDGIAAAGAGGLRPPIPLPRTMAGGQEVEYVRRSVRATCLRAAAAFPTSTSGRAAPARWSSPPPRPPTGTLPARWSWSCAPPRSHVRRRSRG